MLKFTLLLLLYLYIVVEVEAKDPIACAHLKLKNGRTKYRQRGRFVKFMCNVGFIIAGEKYSTCHNGVWDTELPKCVRANCKNVTSPSNGLIYRSHRGAVLNFFCKPGFELKGTNAIYCDGISWDNKLPSCIQANTQPALSCDFENDDLCGWNHDVKHDFDWERGSLQTPSGHLGTGPSSDHTKGPGNAGYYMYIEATSRSLNDTARLISPIYDKINTTVCLEFYYHMHGMTTGQLRVYLKKESSSWDLTPTNALFWKSGNHGDQWLQSWTVIGSIDEDFQIIFEGVRGSSYISDIAIDDVSIIPNCSEMTTEIDTFTTTEDYYDSNLTCANRCIYEYLPPKTNLLGCECDYGCSDKETCCPDFDAYCVWANDDYSVKDETTEMYQTESSPVQESEVPWHYSSTDSDKITRETMKYFTTKLQTTIKTTRETQKPRVVTKAVTKSRPTTKSSTRKVIDEVVTVATILDVEPNTFFAVTKRPTPTTDKAVDKEYKKFSKEGEVHKVKISEAKKAGIAQEPNNVKLITILVASISVSFLIIGASFIVAKRYRYFNCKRLHKVNSSDSQSDVRFLTSDEILNFNLATPDGDDL